MKGGGTPALPDDRRFLAASHAALAIVELFGDVREAKFAKRVGVLTFLLLELMHEQQPTVG